MQRPFLSSRVQSFLAAGFLCGLLFGCGVASDESQPMTKHSEENIVPEPTWYTSFDEALSESKTSGKPLLVDFTGSDWCHWCIVLKDEVFSQPEFKRWAHKNVVLLELDFPHSKPLPKPLRQQNERLAVKYGVQGYPTVLFLDSHGVAFGRSGYMEGGAKNWIAEADKILAWHKDNNLAKQPE